MLDLKKEVRDIRRFNLILFVLAREGFGYLFSAAHERFHPFRKKEKILSIPPEARLRRVLEKLGPTFIKFGQILSLRPDLIPIAYAKELEKLQDAVGPFPFEEAKKIVEQELGKPLSALFRKFEKKEIASASISQVHKAALPTGEIVAVKIQRPGILKMMDTDIEIMFSIARYLERHFPKLRLYHPVLIVEEFKRWTDAELDFRNEAHYAKLFLENAKGMAMLKIPKVYDAYVTDKILTTEFLEGIPLHDVKGLKRKGYNIQKVVENGIAITLKNVFEDGLFHADPHPGNILVMKGNKVGLIDFGIVGTFDEKLKHSSIEMFYGIVEEDTDAVVEAFASLGLIDDGAAGMDEFKREIKKIIGPLQHASLKDVKLSYVLEEVLDTAVKHHIKMPIGFVLFGKAMLTVEGVALEFDPGFELVKVSRPYVEKLINKELLGEAMPKRIIAEFSKYGRFLSELPERVNAALGKIQKGTIKIDVEDSDVKRLGLEIDKSSNRMTYGVLIAALLVTGALLKDVGSPMFGGFPLVSLISFGFAVLIALFLVGSIFREGN
ncbi:hypothetical protein HYU14_04405 [Candidatus Woesearchaeota archaeon]|nr:hypothetical protein [Candidatus Woesearchaeota archaeon]